MTERRNLSLTPTEWRLMECLWEKAPRTGREAIEYLERRVGWSRSTTLTLLRRMTDKGLIRCEEAEGVKAYSPLIQREEAAIQETADFLGRIYQGSVSMMVSAITRRRRLSKAEIEELYAILRKAEEGRDV